MRKGPWAIALLLGGAAVLGWWVLFPSEDRVIKRRFSDLASDVNAAFAEQGLARMAGAARIGAYFTDDVRIEFGAVAPIAGRAALMAVAAQAPAERDLRLAFADVQVTIAPDRRTASAYLTVEVSGIDARSGARTLDAREVEATLEKLEGRWLIATATAVSTLERPPAF